MESKCPDKTLRMRGMNMCILRMLENTFVFAWRDPDNTCESYEYLTYIQ